jgi:hypothetical protein
MALAVAGATLVVLFATAIARNRRDDFGAIPQLKINLPPRI